MSRQHHNPGQPPPPTCPALKSAALCPSDTDVPSVPLRSARSATRPAARPTAAGSAKPPNNQTAAALREGAVWIS